MQVKFIIKRNLADYFNKRLNDLYCNQKDPNEDTEWNAVLRQKGIIPQKQKEITEEQIIDIVERTVQEKLNKGNFRKKS
jgi:hypothetical protein